MHTHTLGGSAVVGEGGERIDDDRRWTIHCTSDMALRASGAFSHPQI